MVETDPNGICNKTCMNNVNNLTKEIEHNGVKLKKNRIFMKGPSIVEFFGKINNVDAVVKPKQSPIICYREQKSKGFLVISILGFLFLFSLFGTSIMFGTNYFDRAILSNLVLRNNTRNFEVWLAPPVKPIMKVHLFNYTNVDEFMSGNAAKLRVEDIGPYVYEETLERINPHFNGNGTLTYRERRDYKFRPDLSQGHHQYDRFTVPNIPLLGALRVTESSYFARWSFDKLAKTLRTKPFLKVPAHRFLFGYDDDLYTLGRPILAFKVQVDYEKFGLLITRNGTSKDTVTINTGEKDYNKVGRIEAYNGRDMLDMWSTNECNRIDGTDGSIFSSSVVRNKGPVYVYNKDMCRKLPFVYEKDIMFTLDKENDIEMTAYRYGIPKNVFAHPDKYSENQCFCHMDTGACPLDGIFNIGPCAYGAPAFMSFPHFYLADPKLVDAIDGLRPDPELHGNFIDIHPKMGFPLRGISRLQFNFQVTKIPNEESFYERLDNGFILPIGWIDMGLEDLPPDVAKMVYHATFTVVRIETALKVFFVLATLITASLLLLSLYVNYSNRHYKKIARRQESNRSGNYLLE